MKQEAALICMKDGGINKASHCMGNDQCLSQDLEAGCLNLAVVKSLGVQMFRGITIYSYFNHKHV